MFTKAQLKLTIFYSLFFFILFWSFTFGLFVWMEKSFGEGYISQVKQQQAQSGQNLGEFDESKTTVVSIAGDVALNRLGEILIIFNFGLFFIIPITSWFLARRTLRPIKQAHELQKQFVSDASHELRTPLSIMLGEVDLALKNKRPTEYYQRVLTSNKEELNRLSLLVENLLFLAREDQSKQKLALEGVDITDKLTSVISSLGTEIKKKKLKINFVPSKEILVTQANSSLLTQLFFNLLDNAVKYTPDKGKITVTLVKKFKNVEIEIKDSGIGIPQADLDNIFKRFYRIDSSRSKNTGYGLGLAICKAIVKKHHGTLSVTSSEKTGSRFMVSLPIK